MKKWKTINKFKVQNSKFKMEEIIEILLKNRGLKTKKEIEEFLSPKLEDITIKSLKIDKKALKKTLERIRKAINEQEEIIIYGDYDADGICGTAILWETLHNLGAKVMPYIPHRIDEGYGLSTKGILNLKNLPCRQAGQRSNTKVIITVDNGIVANEAVDYANKQEIDVIITDHHVLPKKLPKAYVIVHTTKLCGAGIAYLLAQKIKDQRSKIKNMDEENKHLELVALATIADMVPLLGANRTLTKFGLEALKKTKRIGLLELFKEAGLDQSKISTYEVGHIIAPRLNATGRIEHAIDSLRLLCTKDKNRAEKLARHLGKINRERQSLTEETAENAKSKVKSQKSKVNKLLFVSHQSYQQGVIGLVAGKLVEEFYRPAIVVSLGEKYSKASARSIPGFNMIEFIRKSSELLVDAGGHPMAAGFTVETNKLMVLQQRFEKMAEKMLDEEKLTRLLKIDCEIPFSFINDKFYIAIQKLAPFGVGNPEPTFLSKEVSIEDMRLVGNGGKHLKLKIKNQRSKIKTDVLNQAFDAIAFGMGETAEELHIGDNADIVYTINQDDWFARRDLDEGENGSKKLQLKIKDIKIS